VTDPAAGYDILFLCTGNSARSILAEAIMNRLGEGKFRAHSAGSHPKGAVHPAALRLLQRLGHPTNGLRSKSWDEFGAGHALKVDFIVTVCDDAAGEVCPVWPGRPIRAHWGIPDPAAAEGSGEEIDRAFARAYRQLQNHIRIFASEPIDKLDSLSIKRRMVEIHQAQAAAEPA